MGELFLQKLDDYCYNGHKTNSMPQLLNEFAKLQLLSTAWKHLMHPVHEHTINFKYAVTKPQI